MNKDMNILIIGNGFLGSNLYNCYKTTYNCFLTNKHILDVTNEESIKQFFKKSNFTHIIYCAGLKDVSKCEIEQKLAYDINANAIISLSKYIKNEKFIYISTDYVFDGNNGSYKETDNTNPKTIYGKTKLLGEEYTSTYIPNSIVVRTSGVYGKNCKWIDWLLSTTGEICCFTDVKNSPTYVVDLSNMIIEIINKDFVGTINLCGPNKIDRYELYFNLLKYKNNSNVTLTKGKNNNIFPNDISLDTSLYQKITNKVPMSIQQGFKDLFDEN